MTNSIVSKFPVQAGDLPKGFEKNVYSDQIVQSRSITDIKLNEKTRRELAEILSKIDFHKDLRGRGVTVPVSGHSDPHAPIAPFQEQVRIAVEAISSLTHNQAYGLFADMGLGKTLILGMIASHFIKTTKAKRVLYIGVGNWFKSRKTVIKNDKMKSVSVMGDGHKLIAAGGVPPEQIVEFTGREIKMPRGVIFTTYGKLKSTIGGPRLRDKTQVDFTKCRNFKLLAKALGGKNFDGLVVFDEIDEAANVGNIKSIKDGKQITEDSKTDESASLAYLACKELHSFFPQAKFIYSSGTPTTSKFQSIMAMSKLPLWGDDLPVKTVREFKRFLESYKLLFLEEISRELRHYGLINYMAHDRTKVVSHVKNIAMRPADVVVRDHVATIWTQLFDYVEQKSRDMIYARDSDLARLYRTSIRKDLALRMQTFGMLLNSAFRAPTITDNIIKMIRGQENDWGISAEDSSGLSPVLFMDKTFEAGIKREIVNAKIKQGVKKVSALDVSKMDFSMKSDFLALIDNGRWRYEMDVGYTAKGRATLVFKTVKNPGGMEQLLVWDHVSLDYRVVPENQRGNIQYLEAKKWPIYDFKKNKNHIAHPLSEDASDDEKTLDNMQRYEIRMKDPGADELVKKLIKQIEGINFPMNAMDYILNSVSDSCGKNKIFELSGRGGSWRSTGKKMVQIDNIGTSINNFLKHERSIAIVTRAGSRAISLHDRKLIGNRAQRVGIFADFGWNANKTIQASGRILRLGQLHPPIYVLPRLDDVFEYRVTSGVIKAIASQGAITAADARGKNIDLLSLDNDFLDLAGQKALNHYLYSLSDRQPGRYGMKDNTPLIEFINQLKAEKHNDINEFDEEKSIRGLIKTNGSTKGVLTLFNRTMLLPYAESQEVGAKILDIRAQIIDDDKNNDIFSTDRVDLRAGGKIKEISVSEVRAHKTESQLENPVLYTINIDKQIYVLKYARIAQREIISHGFWGKNKTPVVLVPAVDEAGERVYNIYSPRGRLERTTDLKLPRAYAQANYESVRQAWETQEKLYANKTERVKEHVLANGIRAFGRTLTKAGILGLPRDVYPNGGPQRDKFSGLLLTHNFKTVVEEFVKEFFGSSQVNDQLIKKLMATKNKKAKIKIAQYSIVLEYDDVKDSFYISNMNQSYYYKLRKEIVVDDRNCSQNAKTKKFSIKNIPFNQVSQLATSASRINLID